MATYVENKRARFDYEILETFESGIELLGFEVKAVKKHRGVFDGSHVTIRGGEAWLMNFSIPAYQQNNTPKDYDPHRNRRLLLKKKELYYLAAQESKKGLTIIPVSLYSSGNRIKVAVAIVKGKKTHNKREVLKKRDVDREVRREIRDK